MRTIRPPLFAMLCLLLCPPAMFSAVAANAADRAAIQQLFEKSGLTRQTSSQPEMIQETFRELITQTPTSEDVVQSWNNAAAKAYAPDRIMARLIDTFASTFTDQEQAELMSFLDSPLGKRIVELEAGASNVDPEQFAAPLRKLQEDPKANGKRLALYHDVDEATGGAEAWVLQRMNTVLVMEIALLSAAKRTDAIKVKEFKAKLENDRAKMLEDATRSYAVASAFAYKDLTDDELAEYIRVSKTPVWRKYTREALKGMDAALVELAQMMTRELAISGGGGKAL